MKSLIVFQLGETPETFSNHFFLNILDNLISLFRSNPKCYQKWLRRSVRCRKNEILDISEEIIEIIDKSLTLFVLNLRKKVENTTHRRMEDKKF